MILKPQDFEMRRIVGPVKEVLAWNGIRLEVECTVASCCVGGKEWGLCSSEFCADFAIARPVRQMILVVIMTAKVGISLL